MSLFILLKARIIKQSQKKKRQFKNFSRQLKALLSHTCPVTHATFRPRLRYGHTADRGGVTDAGYS